MTDDVQKDVAKFRRVRFAYLYEKENRDTDAWMLRKMIMDKFP